MKTIILRSTNNELFVEIKVDLLDNTEAFTIMSVEDRSSSEVKSGIGLQELPSSIQGMEDYAKARNVLMDIVDIDPLVSTINQVSSVTALSASYPNGTGNVGISYLESPVVAGGNGPFTYTLASGTIPTGLKLDPNTGLLHGTPESVVTANLTVTVSDAFGQSVTTASFSATISA